MHEYKSQYTAVVTWATEVNTDHTQPDFDWLYTISATSQVKKLRKLIKLKCT